MPNMGYPTGMKDHMNDDGEKPTSRASSGEFAHGADSNSASSSVMQRGADNGVAPRSNTSPIQMVTRHYAGLERETGGRAIHPTRASGGLKGV